MRRVCTVLARAGSVGVPGKNVRLLGGVPLIVHSIRHARATGLFDAVLVSTDDPEVRRIAEEAGVVLAIMTFAAIGRGNHDEGMFLGDVFGTALPFLIGWFATAPLTGTFGDDARVSAPPSSRRRSPQTLPTRHHRTRHHVTFI